MNDSTRLRSRNQNARASTYINSANGWTLIELIITLTVLSILMLGAVPIVRTTVKRQKEERLREALREMRAAIDEFHRDTIGGPCLAAAAASTPPVPGSQQQVYIDPRSLVVISDCTIFKTENPDRYPPDLETLAGGVNIILRADVQALRLGGAVQGGGLQSTRKKVYLRRIPIDPMTGEADWELRSSYDSPDAGSWGRENVFDVRSRSGDTALNGERYSDW